MIRVDRSIQNSKGKKIVDFDAYFKALIKKVGYMKASDIVRVNCSIKVYIE